MNIEKLTQQLKDLRKLRKNLKAMHRVFKTNVALAKKMGGVWGHFPTDQALMRNANFGKILDHLDSCIKSVRSSLLEIKLRRK
jgi:hypothetical protein